MEQIVLEKAANEDFQFPSVDKIGSYTINNTYLQKHIDAVLNYPLVEVENMQKEITR